MTPNGEPVSTVAGSVTGTPAGSVPASDVSDTVTFDGVEPVTVATFSTPPASTSACVNTYTALNVESPNAPGNNVTGPPVTVTNGSVTDTSVNVTVPVFVTVNP